MREVKVGIDGPLGVLGLYKKSGNYGLRLFHKSTVGYERGVIQWPGQGRGKNRGRSNACSASTVSMERHSPGLYEGKLFETVISKLNRLP